MNFSVDIKAWLIVILSLGGIIFIYIFLIKPFNTVRIMAGMKPLNREKQTKQRKAYPVAIHVVEKDKS